MDSGGSRSLLPTSALLVLVLALAQPVSAAPPDPAPPAAAGEGAADAKAQAEARYQRGKALFTEGALDLALAEFLAARTLDPALWKATSSAALCLKARKRDDEALEMFESLLRAFEKELPAGAKEAAQREVTALRERVGTIDVADAEPGATLLIDGRDRGELPALAPLRVTAGSHIVRVIKDGFAPLEAHVEVAGGQRARVGARLRALTRSGRLLVTEQGGMALSVVIDGSVMGKTPWEGRLAGGPHVVVLRGDGELGTPPVSVSVELDRTTSLTLAAEELTAALRVEPVPVNASVAIDAVTLGHGIWEGRLRAGAHQVEVAAPGFVPSVLRLAIWRGERRALPVKLQRDPASPFWPRPPREPRFIAELGAAAALVPTFGGDVAGGCVASCRASAGAGGYALIRGGYELGSGLGFGFGVGSLTATQGLRGRTTSVKPFGLPRRVATVDDLLQVRGALVSAWSGLSLDTSFPIHFRLSAGAFLGALYDARSATAGSAGQRFALVSETNTLRSLYLAPEIRIGLPLGRHAEVALALEVLALFNLSRPRWHDTHLIDGGSVGFVTFESDLLLAPVLLLFAPGLGARYDF